MSLSLMWHCVIDFVDVADVVLMCLFVILQHAV